MTIKNKIFLDHNATTPIAPEALAAMNNAYKLPLNPSSTHSFGAEGKRLLRAARQTILEKAGAEGANLVFTSSGTESNNMALRAIKGVEKIVISSIEHDSVLKPASYMNTNFINVDSEGSLDIAHLERECKSLKENNIKYLVSIIHANNETGVIQNINEISPIIYENGGYLHIDASQSFGKIPFDFNSLNVDMATISSHKIGGTKGVAALIVKSGLEIEPFIQGGGQENYLRAGTENLPAIIGFAEASRVRIDNLDNYRKHVSQLIEKFENGLKGISSEIQIFSENSERISNTSNFALPNCDNETSLINLDLKGYAVSSGSACSSGRVVTSHVLSAMGVNGRVAKSALRLSVGLENTLEEIDSILAEIRAIFERKALKMTG